MPSEIAGHAIIGKGSIKVELTSVHPERVACGSDQGRSIFETGVVVSLRRGFQKCKNADMDRKMPFLDGHYQARMAFAE